MKSNRPKISVFIATSLDGYISRENGSIDWLMEANKLAPAGEDCGYKKFISSIDIIIMGRNTFEQVLTFEKWPYDKKVIVMSNRGVKIPDELKDSVVTTNDSPEILIKKLTQAEYKGVYIDGGKTIQSFLSAGLIDEITITIAPVILGSGKSLFGFLEKEITLTLIESHQYFFGFVQLKYGVN